MPQRIRYIPLRNRGGEIVAVAMIDAGDYVLVAGRRWCLSGGYARAVDGVLMHRLLLGLGLSTTLTDHINRNRLDNRRANLRVLASRHESNQNKSSYRPGLERGVYWLADRGRWRARVKLGGRAVFQQEFVDYDEAVAAVRAARARLMPFAMD